MTILKISGPWGGTDRKYRRTTAKIKIADFIYESQVTEKISKHGKVVGPKCCYPSYVTDTIAPDWIVKNACKSFTVQNFPGCNSLP